MWKGKENAPILRHRVRRLVVQVQAHWPQNSSESSRGAVSSTASYGPGPMDKLFSNDSAMAATVARMTACDGVPFSLYTKWADMRRTMARASYEDLPRLGTGIQLLVLWQGDAIWSIIKSKLQSQCSNWTGSSLSFDEWTSVQNCRYMVINVHELGEQFWCLGLVRVSSSMPVH